MVAYQNILVINLMHLGDLMLVTPVLRTLRANYPKARITLLADSKLADIVEFNRHIDECIFIDKKGKDNHMGAFFKRILAVREKGFDLVINLHRNERAGLRGGDHGGPGGRPEAGGKTGKERGLHHPRNGYHPQPGVRL